MSSMRILLIHNSYSTYGGEDRIVFQERDALIEKLGQENVWEYRVSTEGMKPLDFTRHIFYSFHHYREVYDLIKKNKINVVHIHNFFPLLSASIFKAAHNAGAVVVHTLHNFRWWCVNGLLYREEEGICTKCIDGSKWNAVKHSCYRGSRVQSLIAVSAFSGYKAMGVWKYIDKFLVASRFQEEWVKKIGIPAGKIIFKTNWADASSMSPVSNRKGFVAVGRIEAAKGFEKLLSIWSATAVDDVLKIIGTGPLEQELRDKYADDSRIQFLGALPQEETLKRIGESKYLLQLSLSYETFGLTILQAMQQGVPVIGFPIGTRKELIEDGVTGFLCEPDALGTTLMKAAEYEAYPQLCQNAFTFVEQYSREKIIEQQLGLYQEWIHQKNKD